MKRYISLIASVLASLLLWGQTKMNFHFSIGGEESIIVSTIDTIRFNNGQIIVGGINKTYDIAMVDSATFSSQAQPSSGDTIFVTYNGNSVEVDNPFSSVAVERDGANVTLRSSANQKGIVYYLSGSSSNGSFTLYPDRGYTLAFDNLSLSGTKAPIALYESPEGESYTASLHLIGNSTIADSDQNEVKAALYTKSKLKINEDNFDGSLTITGNKKHAINSSKRVELYNGKLAIDGAVSDGINADGVELYGGELNIADTEGDGIDASEVILIENGKFTFASKADDIKALKSDSVLVVSGGEVSITMSGAAAKGMKSSLSDIQILGGTVSMDIDGKSLIANGDTSYSTGIKTDASVEIAAGTVLIKMGTNAIASKGISTKGNVLIKGGDLTIENKGSYYTGATTTTTTGGGGFFPGGSSSKTQTAYTEGRCISSDANITIVGGTINCSTANGAKGIKADGSLTIGEKNATNDLLTLNVTTRCNEKQTTTSSSSSMGGRPGFGGPGGGFQDGNTNKYAGAPKGLVANEIVINSGNVTVDAYDDAVHGNGSITVNGGALMIDATDDGIHSDADMTINNGYIRIKTAYEGLEAKNIYANDGTTYVTTTDDCWNVSLETTGMLRINGGFHYAMSSAGDHDAIDSNGSMEFNGGVVVTCGSSPLDAGDGSSCYQKHTGGSLLVLNNSQGNDMWNQDVKPTCANSIKNTSCSVASGKILCVADANGNVIAAVKTKTSHSKILFAYESSLSGYNFYTATDATGIDFNLFDDNYAVSGKVNSSNLTSLGTSNSGNSNSWGW